MNPTLSDAIRAMRALQRRVSLATDAGACAVARRLQAQLDAADRLAKAGRLQAAYATLCEKPID